MKQQSHLHLDVTVPFDFTPALNELRAPLWLQKLIYPKDNRESNPFAAFLETVVAPSNVVINIHLSVKN